MAYRWDVWISNDPIDPDDDPHEYMCDEKNRAVLRHGADVTGVRQDRVCMRRRPGRRPGPCNDRYYCRNYKKKRTPPALAVFYVEVNRQLALHKRKMSLINTPSVLVLDVVLGDAADFAKDVAEPVNTFTWTRLPLALRFAHARRPLRSTWN
jgi:hypothetical protein